MEYFALLTIATVVIAALAFALFRKRQDYGVLVGVAALYYWSLFGAWAIVIDKTGGFSGKNYHYLEQKLFPIALDRDYLVALGLYAGFIVVVQLTMLAMVERPGPRAFSRVALRHDPILILGFLAAAGSIFLMWDKLGNAFALNLSLYQ